MESAFEGTVPDRDALEVGAGEQHASRRTGAQQVGAELDDVARASAAHRARSRDSVRRSTREAPRTTSAALHLGVCRGRPCPNRPTAGSPGRRRWRRNRDRARRRDRPGGRQVPVAGVGQVEPAELEPRPSVVGRRGEVLAQQVDRHLALALALEGGGAGAMFGSMAACAAQARAPGQQAQHGSPEEARRERRWSLKYPEDATSLAVWPAHATQSGMLPCFSRRVPVPLGPQGPERVDQPRPGVPRIDHVVDVAPRRRRVGVGELARCTPRSAGRWPPPGRRPGRSRP